MESKRQYNTQRHLLLLNCCGLKSIMKGSLSKFLYLWLLFIVLSITLAPVSVSAKTCEQWVAKAVSIEGRVEAKREGETQWQQVQLDETFCAGDQIRVLSDQIVTRH